jgi:hypothetical protein
VNIPIRDQEAGGSNPLAPTIPSVISKEEKHTG